MIYICKSKGCHFIFWSTHPVLQCPDCAKRHLRPANPTERAEYLRRQTEFLLSRKQTS